MSLFNGNVAFGDGNSGRAEASLRIGTDMKVGTATVSPDLTLSVWDQFGSANSATITGLPRTGPLTADGTADDTLFGSVAVGVNFAADNGWSGSMHGAYRVSSDSQGGAVGASISHSW